MPAAWRAAPGEELTIGARVGAGWPGQALELQPQRLTHFSLIDAQGEVPLSLPRFQVRQAGQSMVVLRTDALPIELQASAFEDYLREEGLERVIALRRTRGQSAQPGREMYSRCAKALIEAGPGARGALPPAGLPLELHLLDRPQGRPARQALRVQVLLEGLPLAHALVKASPQGGRGAPLQARTDAQGVAHLSLRHAGVWLLSTVYMRSAPTDSPAQWESLWASLVFARP